MGRFSSFLALFTAILVMFACSNASAVEGSLDNLLKTFTKGAKRDFAQETRTLEGYLKDDADNKDLLIQLGDLYYDWGSDCLLLDFGNAGKGNGLVSFEKWKQGIDYYGRALELEPANVDVRACRANLLRATRHSDEAIAEYRKALSYDPKYTYARIELITVLGDDKVDYGAAIKEYEVLLKVAPEQKSNTDLAKKVYVYEQRLEEMKK